MNPITLVVLLVAVAVAAWLLLQRVTRTGGLFGLSVAERADLLTPLAYALMAPANDDSPFARLERNRDGGGRVVCPDPGCWPWHARVLSVWGEAKFSGGDLEAWGIAVARARDTVQEERGFSIERFLGAVGAAVGGLVTFGGATVAWGVKLGADTASANEQRKAAARAMVESMRTHYEAWSAEIMRVARCPAFWDGHSTVARPLRGGGYSGSYPDYRGQCAAVLRTIKRHSF